MDPIIKRRLKPIIIVYPYIDMVDGDKRFGDSYVLNGYIVPKYGVIITVKGQTIQIDTTIILDGADVDRISVDDEIEAPFVKRCPIQKIIPYPGIITTWDVLEVLL